MEEAGETVGEKPLPTKIHGLTIDLVRNLIGKNNSHGKLVELKGNARLEDEGEIELSLGLSLNGKFGVDPKRAQLKLIRASSVSTFTLNGEENQGNGVQVGVDAPPLIRTCSLPCVMEEELRKRKELLSLRRVEVKRRRMDKLRFSKEGREKVDVKEKCGVENGSNNNNCSDLGFVCSNGDGANPVLQGSEIASQGSGSSGISELESNSIQDSLNIDVKGIHSQQPKPEPKRKLAVNHPGPSNIHSRHCEHKPPIAPRDKPSSVVATGAGKETMQWDGLKNNMPFVSTIGKGPDGKRIQGFLYRYQKGEEVKIMCVCHGSMFSPAEFVRHGGGGDVEHPLKHIVVGSKPFL